MNRSIIVVVLIISFVYITIDIYPSLVFESNVGLEDNTIQMNIKNFLEIDTTDRQDFELKSTYAKTLYENAFNSDIMLGGVVFHTGSKNDKDDTRFVLNYYIKGEVFYIIDPKTDKIYTLVEFSSSEDFGEEYRYLTIFPDVLRIPSYKLTKQTREFDRKNPINDTEMIHKINSIYIYEPLKEVQQKVYQYEEEKLVEYPTTLLELVEHKIVYFMKKFNQESNNFEQNIKDYKELSELKKQCKDKKVYDSYENAYIAGAKGDIKYLDNNCNAKDVSYSELVSFILKDNTDKMRYDYSSFVCADYAEMLHNNAEKAGIKCAYVSITTRCVTRDGTIFGGGGHALNVFNTTDRGLIYIDCTGSLCGSSMDNIAVIKSNAIYYTPLYDSNYYMLPSYMDVENIEVIW